MVRVGPLLLVALVVVLSGCLLATGGRSGYVLSAEPVREGQLADHATVELRGDARAVAAAAADNGTARTVGWRAVRNGSLVATDGAYYRFATREVGQTERTAPGIAVVRTNASADVDVADLPRVDSVGVKLAVRLAQERSREGGSVEDPSYAQPYYRGVEDSRLLGSNGTVVSATGERWRVLVVENVTREATVWSYEAEHVAGSETAFERELSRDLSGLTDAERDHHETAIREDETLVSTERVESGEAEAFRSLLRRLGFDVPADRWEIAGDPQSTYATYDGRTYSVEFWWRSGE